MMLLGEEPGPPPDGLSIGLGIAAVILVAGWVAMRWHRDRMRFTLMKTALDRGVTRFPGTPPYWLLSLRQGVTFCALGIGLGIVGAGACWLARGVEMPVVTHADVPPSLQSPPARTQPQQPQQRPSPPRPEEGEFDRPPRFGGPPPREGEERLPPPPKPQPMERREPLTPGPRNPGPHDPAMERWHRAEAQKTIGLVSVGAGFILLLLGIVRIGFARVEQRYVTDAEDSAAY